MAGGKDVLFYKRSILALGPTQPPNQWVGRREGCPLLQKVHTSPGAHPAP